jgi:hypothetical protein
MAVIGQFLDVSITARPFKEGAWRISVMRRPASPSTDIAIANPAAFC